MAEVQNILTVNEANVDHGQYTAVSVAEDDLSTSLLQLSDYDAGNQTELNAFDDPNFPAKANRPKEGYRFALTQAAHYPQPLCCTFDIIQSFPWAHYDPVKDKLYCHICVMAIKQGKIHSIQDELVTTGFNDWPQANTQLWKHKLRDVHRNAREPPKPPTPPTQHTNNTVFGSFPVSGALRKKKLSVSERYARWKAAQMKKQGESCKNRTPSKKKKPIQPVRCLHPSVAYLIKLVKATPKLYSIMSLRTNISSTWRKVGKMMDEDGYAEFKNGRVCRKFWTLLRRRFSTMRYRYIKALEKAKAPRQVRKPSNASYSKLLWLVPLFNKQETNAESYDMTALDAEQAEDITDEDLKRPSDPSDTAAGKGKVYDPVVIPKVHLRQSRSSTQRGALPERSDVTTSALELISYQLQLLDFDQRRNFEEAMEKLYLEINPTAKDAGLSIATTLQSMPVVTVPDAGLSSVPITLQSIPVVTVPENIQYIRVTVPPATLATVQNVLVVRRPRRETNVPNQY